MTPSLAIPDHPGYRATLDGRIVSHKRSTPVELRPRAHRRTGHLRVRLYGEHLPERDRARVRDAARWADVYVHVLVCLAWHGEPPFEGAMVLHLDDDPTNNHAANLRWGSASENRQHQLVDPAEQRAAAELAWHEWLGVDEQGFAWRVGLPVDVLFDR